MQTTFLPTQYAISHDSRHKSAKDEVKSEGSC